MAQSKAVASERQIPDNPIVLIRYEPENAPLLLAQNAQKSIQIIQSVKAITNVKQMEAASAVISDAMVRSSEVEVFIGSLRDGIQRACERVRELPGYEDFEATLTVRKWGLRSILNDGIAKLKSARAQFLSDEKEKERRAQLAAQAEQDHINKIAADKAAKAARDAGASKETVKEIKQEVLFTPAPIVQNRAATAAQDAGLGLTYTYSAKITSIQKFLDYCLHNPAMLATLAAAIPDIEKAFRKMASDQKERFVYPGIEVVKTPHTRQS